jgi:hypothetical protein
MPLSVSFVFCIAALELHLSPLVGLEPSPFQERASGALGLLTSPQESGSYFGGLFASVQLGKTAHCSLKLNPFASVSYIGVLHASCTYQRIVACLYDPHSSCLPQLYE